MVCLRVTTVRHVCNMTGPKPGRPPKHREAIGGLPNAAALLHGGSPLRQAPVSLSPTPLQASSQWPVILSRAQSSQTAIFLCAKNLFCHTGNGANAAEPGAAAARRHRPCVHLRRAGQRPLQPLLPHEQPRVAPGHGEAGWGVVAGVVLSATKQTALARTDAHAREWNTV